MLGLIALIGAPLLCFFLCDRIYTRACEKYTNTWACLNYVLGCFAAILASYLLLLIFVAHYLFDWTV